MYSKIPFSFPNSPNHLTELKIYSASETSQAAINSLLPFLRQRRHLAYLSTNMHEQELSLAALLRLRRDCDIRWTELLVKTSTRGDGLKVRLLVSKISRRFADSSKYVQCSLANTDR